MQFFEDHTLKLLWLAPIVLALFIISDKKKRRLAKQFAEDRTYAKIATNFSSRKEWFRKSLIFAALTFVVVALARPQWGEESRMVKRKGVDIVFIVDTSTSMLAEDIKPNRMKAAKRSIRNLLERLKGDRVGLVAFAGSSFLQVPLTLDYSAFQLFLDALDVGFIADLGTNIPDAMATALRAFQDTDKDYRVVIIYSDGESHEGSLESLIAEVKQANVRIYAVGMGTQKGGPIPLRSEENKLGGYKKDAEGKIIITALEDDPLKKIAEETGGLYYQASASEKEIQFIYDDIQSIGKKELSERQVTAREDQYQHFLAIALILIAVETVLSERRHVRK